MAKKTFTRADVRNYADGFIKFLNKAVSPIHAVEVCRDWLMSAGFEELGDGSVWQLNPLGKYFVIKNGTALIAFVLGSHFKPGRPVYMVGTHVDSPCLRLKPKPKSCCKNWQQLSVSTYGGGLWRTWFDRDLSVCGRFFVKEHGRIRVQLIHSRQPMLYIPSLAIHLDRDSNNSFSFNAEDALQPIFAAGDPQLTWKRKESDENGSNDCSNKNVDFIAEIGKACGLNAADIVDFELYLCGSQPATVGGMMGDFIFGARLDNLISTYAALSGFVEAANTSDMLQASDHVMVFAAFDNEEVGSQSAPGAASAWTEGVLRRIQNDAQDQCAFERSMTKSFLLSADVSHAVHPNYRSKHDENHTPLFHNGPVLKVNHNQRYATNGYSATKVKRVAEIADVPLQEYTNRNDMPCGSTIGPILSTRLGIETADIGNAVLAMHSIREMASTIDLFHAYRLFKTYFEKFPHVCGEFL
uniref:Aspartyl aminopeptidase n=1 Tax=Trichuris muris TaxID=70415 RepID=A0A5S6QJU6_TRIMR